MFRRWRRRARDRRAAIPVGSAAAGSGALKGAPISSRAAALLAFIADQHLVPEVVPDQLVDVGEAFLEPDLGDVARPREPDRVVALHGPRPGADHEDAVGERDRLLQ